MIFKLSKSIKIDINEENLIEWEKVNEKAYLITVQDNEILSKYLINIKERTFTPVND